MNLNIAATGDSVDFLRQRSVIHKSRLDGKAVTDILIIDDSALDARAMSAIARGVFGRDVPLRHATSLARGINMLLERMPDLILLDDILPPRDRAESSIAQLRKANYTGTIVIISGELTRMRKLALREAGADGMIHKDDLNASSLIEALSSRHGTAEAGSEPDPRGVSAHDDDLL